MSDTTDQPIEADPLGDALDAVAVDGSDIVGDGPWVFMEDARRIAEDAATRAYSDVAANDE